MGITDQIELKLKVFSIYFLLLICFEEIESSKRCTYDEFPDQILYGYNSEVLSQLSLDECKSSCDTAGEECKSFDYNDRTRTCFLSANSHLTDPDLLGKHSKASYYFKSSCFDESTSLPNDQGCRVSPLGQDYAGTVSSTVTGRSCQMWSDQYPHSHSMSSTNMPESSLSSASDYCRNPDGEPGGPWCYTNDPAVRWEYCYVPACQSDCHLDDICIYNPCEGQICKSYPEAKCSVPFCSGCSVKWYVGPTVVDCNVEFTTNCKSTELGREYVGYQSKTQNGRTCQHWTDQYPHQHGFKEGDPFFTSRDGSLANAENYCRNPDSEPEGPWCYTTDPDKSWEYCGIPKCSQLTSNKPYEMPTPTTKPTPCPKGWYGNGNCYWMNSQCALPWKQAIEQCNNRGADLVSFDNVNEKLYIYSLLRNSSVSGEWWTAGFRDETDGDWKWLTKDGEKEVTVFDWNYYEPNNYGGKENIIVIKKNVKTDDFGFNDDNKDKLKSFICEARAEHIAQGCDITDICGSGTCVNYNSEYYCDCYHPYIGQHCDFNLNNYFDDDGWYEHSHSKYLFMTKCGRTWEEAFQECRMMEGNLVYLENRDEMEALLSIIKQIDPSNVFDYWWTAGVKMENGNWQWIIGDNGEGIAISVDGWADGEPNGMSGENTIEWRVGSVDGFNDVSHTKKNAYICKRKINEVLDGYDDEDLYPNSEK